MASDEQQNKNEFWRDLVNNPEMVNIERNWAAWLRVKYDALVEVGFNEGAALAIVCATLRVVSNKNIFRGEINED